MIEAIAILLGCQLAGELLVGLVGLPVPGPVVGSVLLCAGLFARRGAGPYLTATAHVLLRNLSLLFVPAAVGVIEYRGLFLEHGPALLVALVGSTVLALAVAALTFRLMSRR